MGRARREPSPEDAALDPDDHEGPTLGSGDADARTATRGPFGMLPPATLVRRYDLRKLAIGAIFGVTILIAAISLSIRLAGRLVVWLHQQPQSQRAFAEIELDPPPPRWIRTGAAGLLAQVQARSEWRDMREVPVLALDLGRLADAFKTGSPWVLKVVAITRAYPNRLSVHLEYYEPVAFLEMGSTSTPRPVFLDRDGVVLPASDLDPAEADPLIELVLVTAEEIPRLRERPGRSLVLEPLQPDQAPETIAREACRLAEFLKRHQAVAGRGTNRSPFLARFIQRNANGLWVETVEGKLIHWRSAPGSEAPGEMTAEEKWTALQDWLARHRLDSIDHPDFLIFDRDRARVASPEARS